jgi:hypothetical protein
MHGTLIHAKLRPENLVGFRSIFWMKRRKIVGELAYSLEESLTRKQEICELQICVIKFV